MLDEVGGDTDAFPTEQDTENIDSLVFPEWYDSVVDDNHVFFRRKGTTKR
jgi:hypothetical protein